METCMETRNYAKTTLIETGGGVVHITPGFVGYIEQLGREVMRDESKIGAYNLPYSNT